MKTSIQVLVLAVALVGTAFGQSNDGLKVFISVDMEGVTGVVNVDDARRSGKDYDYFRQTMTREANAAIEGALFPGAERTGDWELTYVAQDVMELMLAYRGMRR